MYSQSASKSLNSYHLGHLRSLEEQSSKILQEVRATLNPVGIMFSGGKDSVCIAHLAKKTFENAFTDLKLPFTFYHYDSGNNFPEVLDFRDRFIRSINADLKVLSVPEFETSGILEKRPKQIGNISALIELINFSVAENSLRGLIGGARRDEEGARAKERIFSVRDEFNQWNPKAQRPELWDLYNTRISSGQHLRIFPISDWTELDVWQYIEQEKVVLPSLYFSHEREVFRRDGVLLAYFDDTILKPGENVEIKKVRSRTVGDRETTGFIESNAVTISEVIAEVQSSKYSERSTRADDHSQNTGMEQRKLQGWP